MCWLLCATLMLLTGSLPLFWHVCLMGHSASGTSLPSCGLPTAAVFQSVLCRSIGQPCPQYLSSLFALTWVLHRLKSLRSVPALTWITHSQSPSELSLTQHGSPLSKTVSPAMPLAVSSSASFLPYLSKHVSLCMSPIASRALAAPRVSCSSLKMCELGHHRVLC